MKQDYKIALLGSAMAAGLLWLMRKQKSVDGIGATKKPKRRIWSEVAEAQNRGIDLTDKNGYEKSRGTLRDLAKGKVADDGLTPPEERYFKQLRRAYKSIAGTNLPYKESVVRNEYGDVLLIYHDYDLDNLPATAAEYILNEAQSNVTDPIASAYWITIASIAQGLKFVWKSDGVHRGVEQLIFGASAPAERKQRISYLASPIKGGVYTEIFAHKIWEHWDRQADDQDITDGVLDAIRDVTSVGQAQQMCIDEYIKANQVQEQPLWQDVPF